MTEYEAASLALQQSALTLQEAALAAQRAAVWVAALVGAAQCSLIGYGLYIMRQAARHRDALHRETMTALKDQRAEQSEQHRETMATLNVQYEAQKEQHRETMAAHRENMAAHRENMAMLEGQNEALRELIRRTSAPSAPQDS